MVGYYSDRQGSQIFPEELRAEYKKEFELVRDNKFRGDFILNFSNDASDSLRIVYNSVASVVAPDLKVVSFVVAMDGKKTPHFFRASDHVSFWNKGVSSISIGDTGGLRNPNYHAPTDAISSLDLTFMENVGKATTATVRRLSKAVNGSVEFGKSQKGQKR
jgi:Zn-dependent M28 family amino/carboxypeptidase